MKFDEIELKAICIDEGDTSLEYGKLYTLDKGRNMAKESRGWTNWDGKDLDLNRWGVCGRRSGAYYQRRLRIATPEEIRSDTLAVKENDYET